MGNARLPERLPRLLTHTLERLLLFRRGGRRVVFPPIGRRNGGGGGRDRRHRGGRLLLQEEIPGGGFQVSVLPLERVERARLVEPELDQMGDHRIVLLWRAPRLARFRLSLHQPGRGRVAVDPVAGRDARPRGWLRFRGGVGVGLKKRPHPLLVLANGVPESGPVFGEQLLARLDVLHRDVKHKREIVHLELDEVHVRLSGHLADGSAVALIVLRAQRIHRRVVHREREVPVPVRVRHYPDFVRGHGLEISREGVVVQLRVHVAAVFQARGERALRSRHRRELPQVVLVVVAHVRRDGTENRPRGDGSDGPNANLANQVQARVAGGHFEGFDGVRVRNLRG